MHEVSCMQGWRQTMAVSVEGPNKVLGPAPTCGTNSFHEVCTYPFCRPGSPIWCWSQEKLGGLCSHKDNSTRVKTPCLLKHGGASFSRSLMGGVSTSSHWALLQYKMLFENQCSFLAALLFHLSHHDQGMELSHRPCSIWVMADNGPCSQGAKAWSRPGSECRKTISFKEMWQPQQTDTVPLPLIQTMVSHWSGTPALCSLHSSSLCQAQSVPLCWPLEKLVGVMEERYGLSSWWSEKHSLLHRNDNSFFLKKNRLFIWIAEAVTVHCIQSNLKPN